MTKREFIKKMKAAMKETAKGRRGQEFTCNILDTIDYNIMCDYVYVYSPYNSYGIPIQFGLADKVDEEFKTEVRLNALAMYMAQSLEFGTYKDL